MDLSRRCTLLECNHEIRFDTCFQVVSQVMRCQVTPIPTLKSVDQPDVQSSRSHLEEDHLTEGRFKCAPSARAHSFERLDAFDWAPISAR